MDWTVVPDAHAENQPAQLAAEILASGPYPGTGAMVRAFVQQRGRVG